MTSRDDLAKLFGQYIPLATQAAQYDKDHGGSGHLTNPNIYTDEKYIDPSKDPNNSYLIKDGKIQTVADRNQEQLIKWIAVGVGVVAVVYLIN